MAIMDSFVPQFEHEVATTRRLLAVVPWERHDFKPHPKSMSLGELAVHVHDAGNWCSATLNADSLEVDPAGPRQTFESTQALLESFDKGIEECLPKLRALTDEKCLVEWTLSLGGKTVLAMPRISTLRSFVLSHMIHHRGQLSVYLRLLDVPLPSIYGPSADTPMP